MVPDDSAGPVLVDKQETCAENQIDNRKKVELYHVLNIILFVLNIATVYGNIGSWTG